MPHNKKRHRHQLDNSVFDKMDNERDKNLVNMILNLESNDADDYKKPEDLLDVFIQSKELNLSPAFIDSLEKSKNHLSQQWGMKMDLLALNPNDSNSFLINPLLGKGHLWSTLIKKDGDGFHAFVINKGLRYWHDPVEEFVFKEKNVEKLVKTLNYASGEENIEDVYRQFIKHADEKYNLKINLSPQKVGNCFTKNIQAAVKLAQGFSNKTPDNLKGLRVDAPYTPFGTENKDRTTFKWINSSTENMQKNIVLKLIQKNQAIKKSVETDLKVYIANKAFRQSAKEEKPPVESFLKAFEPFFVPGETSNSQKIKEGLKYMSTYNFEEYSDRISQVVDNSNDYCLRKNYDVLCLLSQKATLISRNDSFTYYMEGGHDPVKSLIKIFGDKKSKVNDVMSLLENFTYKNLMINQKVVKEILSLEPGIQNPEEAFKKLLTQSKNRTAALKVELHSLKSKLDTVGKSFPLIVRDIKEDLQGNMLVKENNYQKNHHQKNKKVELTR